MRRSYERTGVDVDDLGPDPVVAFGRWFADAAAAGVVEPNAMVLATVAGDGTPSARTVLLKGYDGRGLRFFTNLGSAKAADLAANPRAALVFPWHIVSRQVRVTGSVVGVGREEVEAYFGSRPRESQLGAWASRQSEVVASRSALDAALAEVEERFPGEVPTPRGWGGYRVVPQSWEFWAGRSGRLHDRLRYRRTDQGWTVERLAP
jgi:pyridoxamine 5'-phosphate oxidase